MWNTHSCLFCFTSRLFATLLFLNCYCASWRAQEARRRNEGYKRPAPSAGLVGLNWRCKGMGNFRARWISEGRGKVGERKRERSPLFHPFLGPLEKVWGKLEKVWWKFCWKLLWEFAERVVGFWREFAEVCPKKQDATPAPPALDPQNSPPARHRFTGHHTVWSLCHHVIMP